MEFSGVDQPRPRTCMGVHLYVGNLVNSATEEMVRAAFAGAGVQLKSVVILRNPQNDRSRGFGFVELGSEEEALAAAQAMNGVEIERKPIRVGPARERAPQRSPGSSFHSYS